MKAKLTFGIALVLIVVNFQVTFGQATAYANIYATVVAPVGLISSGDLNMGSIEVSQNSSDISLPSKTEITASGLKLDQNGTALLASFSVTDYNRSTFDITLPSNDLVIGDNKSNTMVISEFSSTTSTIDQLQAVRNEIKIAANLRMNEHQMIGNYSTRNPFPVTLNFN